MKIASLLLLFCLTTPILAQQEAPTDTAPTPHAVVVEEAKIVLVAPSTARVGELVRLDVTESAGKEFQWLVIPGSPDFEVYAQGRRAVFSARAAGEYRFVVACAVGDTVDVITHVITIIGPPPEPTSQSLAEWIPFWMWQYDLPLEEKLALADSFEGIASRAQTLHTAQDWIQATAESNKAVLGVRIDAWAPILDKIGAALYKMAQDGVLVTPEQHSAVWMEIASGLRKG